MGGGGVGELKKFFFKNSTISPTFKWLIFRALPNSLNIRCFDLFCNVPQAMAIFFGNCNPPTPHAWLVLDLPAEGERAPAGDDGAAHIPRGVPTPTEP